MKKLKISIITTDFFPTKGGIATLSESLGLHLSLSNEVSSVKMFALQNKYTDVQTINDKYTIYRYKASFSIFLLFRVGLLMFRNRDSDVFHATTVFPSGFILVLFGKIFSKPVFVSYYGTDLLTVYGSKFTKWAKLFTMIHANKSIAFSENTKNFVQEKLNLPSEHSVVISYSRPDGVVNTTEEDKNKVREEFNVKRSDFIVLYVGNLINRKGCHDLFDAIASIEDERVKLIYVGKGPEEEKLKQKQKSLNLEKRIFFAGRRDNPFPFYEIASVFSMPSYYEIETGDIEGLGIVFIEAAMCKVPSVATKSGGIPEAIEDGKTGFLVEERDVEAIKEKIIFLKNNEDFRINMGIRAKVFVEEKFNWRKSVAKYIILYRKYL